jgi:prevent-host-death family protein
MRIASMSDVKAKLSAFVEGASREGPVVITRNGRAVAVLVVPADDDDLERLLLAYSPQLREILDESERSIREGKGMSWDQVMAQADREANGRHEPEEAAGEEAAPESLAVAERPPAYRARQRKTPSTR